MGFTTINNEEDTWKLLKGNLNMGGINFSWDFTNGLSKEEYIKREQLKRQNIFISKNGRLIIPKLGIY